MLENIIILKEYTRYTKFFSSFIMLDHNYLKGLHMVWISVKYSNAVMMSHKEHLLVIPGWI